MSWKFKFRKNVHMYSHELKCESGSTKFFCQSEDSAQEEKVVMFWLDDVPLDEKQIIPFSKELEAWAKEQGFKFRIYMGNECLSAFVS